MTEQKQPKQTKRMRKLLQADILEMFADKDRQIRRPPHPPKRRQPKITRMQSRRMYVAQSQSINAVRAIYSPESKWNMTPLAPEGFVGTRNVGPNDPALGMYRAGKATVQPPLGYSKDARRARQYNSGAKSSLRKGRKTDEAELQRLADAFKL